jgi:carbamoyltransferase
MIILGINCVYHESAACLVIDGNLIAAVEEERFNRTKHAKVESVSNPDELPVASIDYCFAEASRQLGRPISFAEVDYLGYSFLPEVRFERNTAHRHPYPLPDSDFGTLAGESVLRDRCLDVEGRVRELGFAGSFHFLSHHRCHAASAFFMSPFAEAAVLVVDGIGEFESTTAYHGKGARLKRLWGNDYPNSIGFLWEKIPKFLGFGENDACKVMGLASYGQPERFAEAFASFVTVADSFTMDDEVLCFRNGEYSGLEKAFGVSRRSHPVRSITEDTRVFTDIAATLQNLTEDILLGLCRRLRAETGCRNLALAGGVALNCVANARIARESGFDRLFVQPAAHDAGTALGAAYLLWYEHLDQPRQIEDMSPYLGPEFSEADILSALRSSDFVFERHDDITTVAAKLLADGKIVAWFQGRMEIGPRALGNRSLLADPRRANVREVLNQKVKHREAFRPFCPSVLADKAADWFDVAASPQGPEHYMLSAVNVRPDVDEEIPAVVHVDGTARVQMVEREANPRYYELIERFAEITGVPVLLNTSFNYSEPIVCSPDDALNTFRKTQIDWLVLGDYCVSRELA